MFNETDLETMAWVRDCFNPDHLANPNKLFPTPRCCGESANAQQSMPFKNLEVF
jgi:glycolate oxidase